MKRWNCRFASTVIVSLLCASVSCAQSGRSAFDVASVKRNMNCGGGGVPGGTSPGRIDVTCATLRGLIRTAYSVFRGGRLNPGRVDDILGGPRWLDTDQYEIAAKAEGNPPRAEMMGPMLQTLLEERFKLKVHTELRDAPVYILTLARNNAKLQPSKEGSCAPMDLANLPGNALKANEPMPKYCGSGENRGSGLNMVSDWHGVTMVEFASRMLSSFVERPVVDKTGLSGRYDVHLEFVRGGGPSGRALQNGAYNPDSVAGTSDSSAAGPSIFTALREQAGLKLVPDKSPLEVIVIDYVERPSVN